MTRATFLNNALRYLLLTLGAIVLMMPFLYMLSTSFKPHAYVLELPPRPGLVH